MNTHTPGPWKSAKFNKAQEPYGAAIYYEPDNDGAVDIAHLILDGREPWAMEADARLIAAAPELLEAMRAIVAKAEQFGGVDTRLLAQARAAIAKATGETTATSQKR